MPCQSPALAEVLEWGFSRNWTFHCLLCPAGRTDWLVNSHPDLNRIHDHLNHRHVIPFYAFFCCTHEHEDGHILWRLPDGRPCLCVTRAWNA